MSSWRNLMTPLYEKHYLKDSSNSSSMSQSNFAKISTLQMKESIGYSDKLKDLQSQMSRLKGELTKYSTRDKNPKKSVRARNEFSSPEKATESYFGITTQIQEESSFHDNDKPDLLTEDHILASPELTKKRRSKGRIVRNSLRNANVYDSPYAKPNHSELLSMNRTRETETSLYDDHQAKTYMGPGTEVIMEYENKMTTQKLHKRGSHRERHEEASNESGTLKNALAECCLEINNLKQVVLDSQDQIKYLCEELSKEKKKSNELREELQQCSVVLSHRKHNTTFAGTPLRKELATGKKTYSQDVKRQILWSNRQREVQPERTSHVTCKGFDDYGRLEEEADDLKIGAIRPRREESSSKDFSRSRHEQKEIAVQCDFMLDGIMDSHEEEVEMQKEEISNLKNELANVKNHKNDLIESFQQIVGLLTAPDTTKAKALQDTQNIFSDYYNAINAKMGEVLPPPTQNFNSGQKNSRFKNSVTSNYMGKSRHNRTEISDNLMYSPSNTAMSFENELMESRLNNLVHSLKFGSILNNNH